MSEWKECKLGDIAIITDCEHKTAPLVDSSEFISVRTSNIQNGKIDFENSNRVSSEVYEEWTKRLKPNVGDIVLAREAPVGEVGWIPEGKKVCLGQRTVLIRITDKSINPKYLLYYLVNDEVKNDLINRSTGSVVEHLNVKDIKNFDIRIHDLLEEQVVIANIVTRLDDKIDLLHRQNATLEKMAETLFRQWFVKEAKEDWQEGTLKELVETANTGLDAIQRAPIVLEETGIKCLRIQDISQEKPFHNWGNSKVKESDFEKARLRKDDIIMARTCSPGIIFFVRDDLNAVFNNGLARIRPNKEKTYSIFLYYLFKTDDFIGHIYGISDGTSVQLNMKLGDLLSYKIQFPPKRDQDKYYPIFQEIEDKISRNKTQIRTLTALRDALLPKLMSGEVRVEM